jgi:hypothetical protein
MVNTTNGAEMSRGLRRAQQQLLHAPYLPSLRTPNVKGPNGWSADPKSMPLEECDAFVLHASDKLCLTGNVTERTKCRPSPHMIEPANFLQCLFRPFLWTKWPWTAVVHPASVKFSRSPWRSRVGKRDD